MEAIYPYVKIVHIFCAIIFLGYIFFDVVIFSRLKNELGESYGSVKQKINVKAIKIMPVCLVLLILTGGMMITNYIGFKAGGFFQDKTQIMFSIKAILGFLIFFGAAFSIIRRLTKKPNPIGEHFHHVVLVLGIIIVLLAKLAV